MSPSSSRSRSAAAPADPAPDAAREAPVASSYEAAMTELEGLVAAMEGGQLELEASLAAYQRGSALLRYCQAQLAAAEQQVKMLEDDALVEVDANDEQE